MREFSRKEEEKDEYSIPEGERKNSSKVSVTLELLLNDWQG
jgi:hypothetical protein